MLEPNGEVECVERENALTESQIRILDAYYGRPRLKS